MPKLKKNDVGHLCLVKWDDVGRQEGMLIEVDDDGKRGKIFNDKDIQNVESEQVVKVGNAVTPNSLVEVK